MGSVEDSVNLTITGVCTRLKGFPSNAKDRDLQLLIPFNHLIGKGGRNQTATFLKLADKLNLPMTTMRRKRLDRILKAHNEYKIKMEIRQEDWGFNETMLEDLVKRECPDAYEEY